MIGAGITDEARRDASRDEDAAESPCVYFLGKCEPYDGGAGAVVGENAVRQTGSPIARGGAAGDVIRLNSFRVPASWAIVTA